MNHMIVSIVKSAIRIISSAIVAYIAVDMSVKVLSIGYGIAEFLGILEEIVDKRKEI